MQAPFKEFQPLLDECDRLIQKCRELRNELNERKYRARSIREAEEIHGDLRPYPRQGAREVPLKSDCARVLI